MRFRQQVATVSAIVFSATQAFAAPDFTQAQADITHDSALLSHWMTDQMKDAVAFNSTAGNVVPRQLKLLGFEFGVEGIVSDPKMDVSGFHTLPTSLVNTQKISMKDRLPFPAAMAQAKIGLPFGLDAGLRAGGIPDKKFDNGDTHVKVKNSIMGVDLRKKLVDETALKPFGLTMGLNYTRANGYVDTTTPYNGSISQSGHTATLVDSSGNEHTQWKTSSVGAQAILNKKIAIFNPYIGASANRNWGHVSSALTTAGTLEMDNDPSSAQAFSASANDQQDVRKWDLRGLAGLELTIFPFMRLDVGGEYAGSREAAANVGLRFQFR